jgi:hypothetical protein
MDVLQPFQVVLACNSINNLSEEVMKGMSQKVKNGGLPSIAPTGYLNRVETRKIFVDPKRGPLVRRIFEFHATGRYSLGERSILSDDGLHEVRDSFYRQLTNPARTIEGSLERDGAVQSGFGFPLRNSIDRHHDLRPLLLDRDLIFLSRHHGRDGLEGTEALSVDEFDRVADLHGSFLEHGGVEREAAFEVPTDLPEHAHILRLGVRIERRHDAAFAKVVDCDEDAPDSKALPFPSALGLARDSGNHQVRAEPPAIVSEGLDGAVRGDEERKDIKAVGPFFAHEAGAGARRHFDVPGDLPGIPGSAVHERSLHPKRRAVPQEPGLRTGGDGPAVAIPHLQEPVAPEPETGKFRPRECLPSHRFHRVAPQLRDLHEPDNASYPLPIPQVLRDPDGFFSLAPATRAAMFTGLMSPLIE